MEVLKGQVRVLADWYCNPGVVSEALTILHTELGKGQLLDLVIRDIIEDIHTQRIEKDPLAFKVSYITRLDQLKLLRDGGYLNG